MRGTGGLECGERQAVVTSGDIEARGVHDRERCIEQTDGGEHAWGRELVYLDGRLGDEKNNEFPVAYARAYGDLLRRCGRARVTFSRAGYVGSQAFGAFRAGDENSTWAALRWSLHAGLNAAACGVVYWGWDLAGFSAEVPTAELYLRAAAAATFVPIMQYHS